MLSALRDSRLEPSRNQPSQKTSCVFHNTLRSAEAFGASP